MAEQNRQLSHLAHSLKGSQILQYSNAVKAMMKRGEAVHNFTVGDFDPAVFPIPIELKNEVMKAYAEDYTCYPMAEGNLDLRQAISRFEKKFNNLSYGANEILVASGGRPLIYTVFQIICDHNDTVLYGTPSWNNAYFATTVGAKAIEIETDSRQGFLLTEEAIAPHIREATLLCICSPQNPTGTLYSKKTLLAITNLVVEENKRRKNGKKLYLIFDSIYGCLASGEYYNYNPLQLNPEIRPYLITVNAVSKIFAATGMRVGWCLGPESILQKMRNLLTHVGAWAPMAEQKATARFLQKEEAVADYLKKFRNEINDRLQAIYNGLMRLKTGGFPVDAIKPQGGIYLSVQFKLIGKSADEYSFHTAADIADYLLKLSGFAILPFSVFGSSKELPWFRISVGTCRKYEIPMMLKQLELVLEPFRIHQLNESLS